MFQQDYLFFWKFIEENVFFGLKIVDMLMEDSKVVVFGLLLEFGFIDVEKKYLKELLGGMCQWVVFVRIFVLNLSLFLLDELFFVFDFQIKLLLENLVFCILKEY